MYLAIQCIFSLYVLTKKVGPNNKKLINMKNIEEELYQEERRLAKKLRCKDHE